MKMREKSTELFASAPIPKAVFTNMIPAIISMIMVMIYNLADTFFIAQTKDHLMIAAISVSSPAFFFFMAIGSLFGIGGTSLISRSLGAGKGEKAKHISSFCFWTGTAIGIVSALLIHFNARSICYMIGASDDTIGYATEYLDILSFAIPLLIIGNTFSNIIRAEGKPQIAMIGTVVGNLINIVLDPILISGLKLDVRGAAIATVLGNVFSAGFYIYHLSSKHSMLSLNPKLYRAGEGIAFGVFAIGIPAALNSLLMTASNIILNSLMSKHNDLAVAGLGVAMKVNSIAVMVLIGMGFGVQPLLGYNFGARNKERFNGIMRFSLLVAFIGSLVMTIICYCAAGPLVRIFLDNDQAFDYGFQFCRILIYAGPVLGFMFIFQNAIQATGAVVPAMILSVCRQGLILIPLYYLSNHFFHTPRALTMCAPIADYSSTAISVILFIYTMRKYFGEAEMVDKIEQEL